MSDKVKLNAFPFPALPVTKQEICRDIKECEEKLNLRQKGNRLNMNLKTHKEKKYMEFLQQLQHHGVNIVQTHPKKIFFSGPTKQTQKLRRTKRRLKTTTTASPEYSYYSVDTSSELESKLNTKSESGSESESDSSSESSSETFEEEFIIIVPSTLPPRQRTTFNVFTKPTSGTYPTQPSTTKPPLSRFTYQTILPYSFRACTPFTTTTPTTTSTKEASTETTRTKKKRTKTRRSKKRTTKRPKKTTTKSKRPKKTTTKRSKRKTTKATKRTTTKHVEVTSKEIPKYVVTPPGKPKKKKRVFMDENGWWL